MAYLTDITEGPKSYATLQLMWSKVRQPRPDRLRFVVCYARPRNTVRLTRAALRLINHSCDPNAAFNLFDHDPDQAKWHVYALKRITAGEPGSSSC